MTKRYINIISVLLLLFVVCSKAKEPPADLGYDPPEGWEFVMKLDSVSGFFIHCHNDTCYLAVSFSGSREVPFFIRASYDGGNTWEDIKEAIPRTFIKSSNTLHRVTLDGSNFYYEKSYDFYKTSEKYLMGKSPYQEDTLYQSPVDDNLLIATFDYWDNGHWSTNRDMFAKISHDGGKTWETLTGLYRHSQYGTIYTFNFDWAEKGHWFVKAEDGDDYYGDFIPTEPPVFLETFDDGKSFRQIKFDPIGYTDSQKKIFGLDGKNSFRNLSTKYNNTITIYKYDDSLKEKTIYDWLYKMDSKKPKSNIDSGYTRTLFTLFEHINYSNYNQQFLPTLENFNDSLYENKIYIYTTLYYTSDKGNTWLLLNYLNEKPLLRETYLDQGSKTLWMFVRDEKYHPNQHMSYLKGSLWKLKLPWESTGVESVQKSDEIFVYPNPVSDRFSIVMPENKGKCSISLIDLLGNHGELLFDGEFTNGILDLNLPKDIMSGTYFIKIKINNSILLKKIIVVK